MQIGTNVSNSSSAYYQSNTTTKYSSRGAREEVFDLETVAGVHKAENGQTEDTEKEEDFNYLEFIRERKNEILEKVKKGETEPSFQIGAASFTEKEWNKLLEEFDEAEEVLKELMREEHAKRLKENVNKTEIKNSTDSDAQSMLLAEATSCSYPAADPKDEDIRYITWYTEEGIFCRKAGQTEGYEWSISFENRGQYDKVMDFLKQFSQDDNLRFAANENFWKDFLD